MITNKRMIYLFDYLFKLSLQTLPKEKYINNADTFCSHHILYQWKKTKRYKKKLN